MNGLANSTIAALFYAHPEGMDFHDLAAKLASALLHNADGGLQIHTDYDDVVIFDQADLRIGLSRADMTRDFPEVVAAQGCRACFLVSVGVLPDGTGRSDHGEICARLSAQIEARYPADGEVLLESDVAFSEDTFDSLLEDIVSAFVETRAEPQTAHQPAEADVPPDVLILGPDSEVETRAQPQAAQQPAQAHIPPDVLILGPDCEIVVEPTPTPESPRAADRFEPIPDAWAANDLIARYDREMARRDSARSTTRSAPRRRSPGPTVFPNAEPAYARAVPPRGNGRAASTFGNLRPQPTHAAQPADALGARAMALAGFQAAALDPVPGSVFPPIAEAHSRPLAHRTAVNALNVAVMAFSLPVGAMLMTLAVLGRESMVASSRATALTGAGIGISQNDAAMTFLHSLIS